MALNAEAKTKLRGLLIVFLGAILVGILLTIFLVYNYGPSGRYQAGNVLLEPDLVKTLSYNDQNLKTGSSSRFVFDQIIFSYMNGNYKVDLNQYSQIYALLQNDVSIKDLPEKLDALFTRRDLASLFIKVRTESNANWQEDKRIFESITFIPDGDYYRIHLHDENKRDRWVYFYHPNVYNEILKIVYHRDQ